MSDTDIYFYFDPVCPFAWMTSKWVRQVAAQRDYTVDWRFISLRMINAAVDYDSQFPPGYEAGHTAGLKLLRVAARVRAEYGRDKVGPLYEAIGARCSTPYPTNATPGAAACASSKPILAHLGLPGDLADALDDSSSTPSCAGDGRGTRPHRQGRRNPHHPLPAPRWYGVLRAGDQPTARRSRRHSALGPRRRPRWLPRVRRAQAQPARAAPAAQLRGRHRPGRHPRGLARRQPTHQEVRSDPASIRAEQGRFGRRSDGRVTASTVAGSSQDPTERCARFEGGTADVRDAACSACSAIVCYRS